jgi:hypothetical protein
MIKCYLDITDWTGYSLGAVHCYGKIKCEGTSIDLLNPLTQEDCDYLNTGDDTFGLYQVGELSQRFNNPDQVRAKALVAWKVHFPQAEVLIEGSASVGEPQPMLASHYPHVMTENNKLYEQAEACGGWDENEAEMMDICHKWDQVMEYTEE